jgi:hypothetical protein
MRGDEQHIREAGVRWPYGLPAETSVGTRQQLRVPAHAEHARSPAVDARQRLERSARAEQRSQFGSRFVGRAALPYEQPGRAPRQCPYQRLGCQR